METYKNPFHPQKDAMLWELHEIRHELHQTLRHKTIEEINADAFRTYQRWQREAQSITEEPTQTTNAQPSKF